MKRGSGNAKNSSNVSLEIRIARYENTMQRSTKSLLWWLVLNITIALGFLIHWSFVILGTTLFSTYVIFYFVSKNRVINEALKSKLIRLRLVYGTRIEFKVISVKSIEEMSTSTFMEDDEYQTRLFLSEPIVVRHNDEIDEIYHPVSSIVIISRSPFEETVNFDESMVSIGGFDFTHSQTAHVSAMMYGFWNEETAIVKLLEGIDGLVSRATPFRENTTIGLPENRIRLEEIVEFETENEKNDQKRVERAERAAKDPNSEV